MIVNVPQLHQSVIRSLIYDPCTRDSLLSLVLSDQKYYLGGSRRMAQKYSDQLSLDLVAETIVFPITPNTDYDFYTTYSKRVERELASHGFKESHYSYTYLDTETLKIYININNKVQVVLRRCASFYEAVFENIDPVFFYNHLWKSSPVMDQNKVEKIQDTFNMLFQIGRATQLLVSRDDIF